jgi:PAS domain S-box-containing protein
MEKMSRQKSSPTNSRHHPIPGVTKGEAESLDKKARKVKQKGAEPHIAHLEQELARTRDELKTIIEEQENTSDELQSFNEELQAANEQLVTRTEQLQSSNKELIRLNEQLSRLNSDLSNLLNSIRIPIVMLREDLRIGRFTPTAAELFNLKPEDIGRPLRDIRPKVQVPDLERLATKVIDTLETQEHEIQDREGRWYSLRIRPYKTHENRLGGAVVSLVDIDDVKRSVEYTRQLAYEQAARAEAEVAQRRITQILESIMEGFFAIDQQWRFTYLNPQAERLVRRSREDLIGKSIWDLFPEALASPFYTEARRAATEGTAVHFEAFYPPLNCWFESHIYPGEEGLAVFFRDITGRKRAEEALRANEERFRLIARATHDVVWDWNLLTNELWWNEGFQMVFGYQADEIQPTIEAWFGRIHPDDRDPVMSGIQAAINSGRHFWSDEYRYRRSNGSYALVTDHGFIVRDKQGKPLRMIGAMSDITSQREAEKRIHLQANLLDAVGQAVIATHLDGSIIYWNRFAETLYGWSAPEVMGRNILEVTPTQATQEQAAEILCRVKAGESWSGEFLVQRRDGTVFPAMVTTSPIQDSKGVVNGIIGISADITERRRSEEALSRHAKELARSNAELEQFAYVASHDLQEPLRMISLYTQLLARRYQGKLDADADEFIGYVIGGAGRMHQLINDLLTYSQVSSEAKQFKPTDCETVMRHVLADLRAKVEQLGAEVSYDRLPRVKADPSQLGLLFRNLIDNALKYHGQEPIRVHVTAEQRGREWLFSVRDNGIGIDPQYAERIFVIFQRLHNHSEYPGTGIGLAICRRVVERHGGGIWVESQLGQGATFRFTLSAGDRRSSPRLS